MDFSSAYEQMRESMEGTKEVYQVAKEIDYNGIWNALTNFADNAVNHPVATALAAGTVLALGYLAARGVRFWGTRGQGTIFDRAERKLGTKVFREYFEDTHGHGLEDVGPVLQERNEKGDV